MANENYCSVVVEIPWLKSHLHYRLLKWPLANHCLSTTASHLQNGDDSNTNLQHKSMYVSSGRGGGEACCQVCVPRIVAVEYYCNPYKNLVMSVKCVAHIEKP